jgi:hypothetical protein
MKTAFYWPTFLGPLGQQADFWAATNLLLETLTASEIELFVDTDPSRRALERLFEEIRKGSVNRLVVRSLCDLCLTVNEFGQFLSDVTEQRVKVEQIFDLLPSILVRKHPELVGRYRHRQRAAKIVRLRQASLTISEIGSLARATPQQVCRILSRPR